MLSKLPQPAVNRIVVTSYDITYNTGVGREMAKKDFEGGPSHVVKIQSQDKIFSSYI